MDITGFETPILWMTEKKTAVSPTEESKEFYEMSAFYLDYWNKIKSLTDKFNVSLNTEPACIKLYKNTLLVVGMDN